MNMMLSNINIQYVTLTYHRLVTDYVCSLNKRLAYLSRGMPHALHRILSFVDLLIWSGVSVSSSSSWKPRMYCGNVQSLLSSGLLQDPQQLPRITTGRHCRGVGGGAIVDWREDTQLLFHLSRYLESASGKSWGNIKIHQSE